MAVFYFTEKMEEIRTPKCPLHVHIHLPILSTVYCLLLLGIKYSWCYLRLTLQLIHQITIPPLYQVFCFLAHSQGNINISYKKPFFDPVTCFIHQFFHTAKFMGAINALYLQSCYFLSYLNVLDLLGLLLPSFQMFRKCFS